VSRAPAIAALALWLAATPAAAQLGLDLGAPPAKPEPAKKTDTKKADPRKTDAKKADPKKTDTKQAEPAKPAEPVKKAEAPRPAEPAKPPAAISAEARAQLDAAKRAIDARKYESAALGLDAILRNPAMGEAQDEARYLMAKSLAQLGLYHASLGYLDELLDRGPARTRYFHNAQELLFQVSRKLSSEQVILSRVAKLAHEGAPAGYEDRFYFLLSKYEFERGRALEEAGKGEEARASWREAIRLAGQVRSEAGAAPAAGAKATPGEEPIDLYGRALFLEGLARFALGDEQAAMEKFKDVIRLTNPKKGRVADGELRELTFLQLARLHYQNKQNRYAIFYYGKMPWGGPQWLEGLWEASYAHYRIGEHEKALGNLLTLQSAYFKDEYYPESWVLKAIIYYENCRYPEARLVLDSFNAIYEPLYDELVAITARPAAPSAFMSQAFSPRVRRLMLSDQAIRQLMDSAAEVDAEVDKGIGQRPPEFRDSKLAATLKERLARVKSQLLTEAGLRARARLEYERDQLRSMLAQALRISIEVSRQEREALEGSLTAGRQVEVVKDLRWTHAVSDEQLYWPYEGEFWRDELGTYSYTLTKGCKDRPPRSSGR
jgi:hypothetical protein